MKKERETLLLNHTRMGDLIQTMPLVRAIRQREPEGKIRILANVKFSAILDFFDGIDEVIELDIKQFEGSEEIDILALYEYLDRLTTQLAKIKPDELINLSHSKLSALLALVAKADSVRGFIATKTGERLTRNPWLIYFSSLLGFRKLNRFNLVEIYLRAGGFDKGLDLRAQMSAGLGGREIVQKIGDKQGVLIGDKKIIGIQAGASREDRRWPPAKFAAVADRLAEKFSAVIIFFGSGAERELAESVGAMMQHEYINMAGETSIGELAKSVSACDLLLTNDTGTMHIAVATCTPVVALFFVHARAEETGPCGMDDFVISAKIDCAPCSHDGTCDHFSCFDKITIDDVFNLSVACIEKHETIEGDFKTSIPMRSGRYPDGGYDLVPVAKNEICEEDFFAYIYRPLVIALLENWNRPESMIYNEDEARHTATLLLARFEITDIDPIRKWSRLSCEAAEAIEKTADESAIVSEQAGVEKDGNRLDMIAQKLHEADLAIEKTGQVNPPVSPLCILYKRRVENLFGESTRELAEDSALALRWLSRSANMFFMFTKNVSETILHNIAEKENSNKPTTEKMKNVC